MTEPVYSFPAPRTTRSGGTPDPRIHWLAARCIPVMAGRLCFRMAGHPDRFRLLPVSGIGGSRRLPIRTASGGALRHPREGRPQGLIRFLLSSGSARCIHVMAGQLCFHALWCRCG